MHVQNGKKLSELPPVFVPPPPPAFPPNSPGPEVKSLTEDNTMKVSYFKYSFFFTSLYKANQNELFGSHATFSKKTKCGSSVVCFHFVEEKR